MMDEFRAYSAATDGVFTLPTEGAGQVLMEWYDRQALGQVVDVLKQK